MIEYELLKIIWWVLVGVLLIGFALTDGFDMGSMAIMPFVGQNDEERRAAINTIARIGMVTRSGLLLRVVPCLLPGQWSMQLPSPACTGPCYWSCLRCSYVRSALTTAPNWKIPNGVIHGTGVWPLVVQFLHWSLV